MARPPITTGPEGAERVLSLILSGFGAAEGARLSTADIIARLREAFRLLAAVAGLIVCLVGELDRREGWRSEGATSLVAWLCDRMGLSNASAHTFGNLGEKLLDLPHLAIGLSSGAVSLDKVKAIVSVADPESDARWARDAAEHTLKDLVGMARSERIPSRASDRVDDDRRSLRCNDAQGTISARLPALSYATVKGVLEERARAMPSDGEIRWDQRLADAFVSLTRNAGSPGPPNAILVAHAPLEVLRDPSSNLPGELQRGGLISATAIRELACDATLIIAADDRNGHTMYEGRQRRLASPSQRRELWRRDRHCRFPGCAHALFTIAHHVHEWDFGGLTDLPNLALLCEHHHHLIHSQSWSVRGNANQELAFVGPSGEIRTTRPSPLWTQVSDPARLAERRAQLRTEDVDATDPTLLPKPETATIRGVSNPVERNRTATPKATRKSRRAPGQRPPPARGRDPGG